MNDALVYFADGTGPLWSETIPAVPLLDGLFCVLSPLSARLNPGRGVLPGDELVIRCPGQECRVRVELVRQPREHVDWSCFVVRALAG